MEKVNDTVFEHQQRLDAEDVPAKELAPEEMKE